MDTYMRMRRGGVLRFLIGFGLPSFELLFLTALFLCKSGLVHNGYPLGCWFGTLVDKMRTSCRVNVGFAFSKGGRTNMICSLRRVIIDLILSLSEF